MKSKITLLMFITAISLTAQAQQVKAQLLKDPADWAFERFTLPPAFAPGFPYKGAEELRFSPGMFNKDSTNYFTYAFVAQLDNTASISQDNIRDYLLYYFKGLCMSTANDRKLVIDTTMISVSIKKKTGMPGSEIYDALLNVFGVFADGAPVRLNMEVEVLTDIAGKKTYLLFIASPREKTDELWKKLYKIREAFVVPAN